MRGSYFNMKLKAVVSNSYFIRSEKESHWERMKSVWERIGKSGWEQIIKSGSEQIVKSGW